MYGIAQIFSLLAHRACPECRTQSDYVVPSRYWVDDKDKEDKDRLLTSYQGALRYCKQKTSIIALRKTKGIVLLLHLANALASIWTHCNLFCVVVQSRASTSTKGRVSAPLETSASISTLSQTAPRRTSGRLDGGRGWAARENWSFT